MIKLLSRAGRASLFEWSLSPLPLFGPNLPPEDSTVTFKCGCSAHPKPEIYWENSASFYYNAPWLVYKKGVSYWTQQIEQIFHVNSTLTVTTKRDAFGLFLRCRCITWHTYHWSKLVQLLFTRMHVISFLSHSGNIKDILPLILQIRSF